MKESELKEHELLALNCYRLFEKQKKDVMLSNTSKTGALYQFGKDIAEKLEPELKPVDMSVLVNSGVDCVFAGKHVGGLVVISESKTHPYKNDLNDVRHRKCKPRMNYWFSAENFKDVKDLVKKLEEAGFELEIISKTIYGYTTITAFMIKDKKANRCWPWEVE